MSRNNINNSQNKKNSFFSKIYIESYESENSEDSMDNQEYNFENISLFCNIFRNFLKTRFGNLLRNLYKFSNYKSFNEGTYRLREDFNPIYISDEENEKFYFPNNEESFLSKSIYRNDLINEQEQIKILKFEILRSKFLQVTNIFNKYLSANFLNFVEKMRVQNDVSKIFNKDDNFLYFLPKLKLNRFRSIYAFRRLIYVINSFQFRIRSKERNSFDKWRDLSRPIYFKESRGQIFFWKLQKFVYYLENIFKMKDFKPFIAKLFFLSEVKINLLNSNMKNSVSNQNQNSSYSIYRKRTNSSSAVNNIKQTAIRNNQNFSNLNTNEKIYQNLFNFFEGLKRIEIYYIRKLKDNFWDLTQILSSFIRRDTTIELIKFHRPLKRIFFTYYYFKNFSHCLTSLKFYNWRKIASALKFLEITSDTRKRKRNELKNIYIASNYLDYIHKQKNFIGVKFSKQKFFEKMKFLQKIRNTLYDYATQYKKIPFMISDSEERKNLYQIRNTFLKVLLMKKILLKVDKKKYANLEENYGSVLYDTVKIQQNEKMLLFYKWKKLAIYFYRDEYINKIFLINIFSSLERKFKSHKFEFFSRIELIKNLRNSQFQFGNKIYFVQRIFSIISINFNFRYKNSFFNKIDLNWKIQKIFTKFKATGIIFNFTKIYKLSFKSLLFSFNKWKKVLSKKKFSSQFPFSEKQNLWKSEKMRKLFLIQKFLLFKYEKNLKYFFTKFKIQTRNSNRGIFIKSKPLSKIDHLIVQNQTRVMHELEKEEIKLNKEITKVKNYFTGRNSLIIKFFMNYQKKIFNRNCGKYLKIWRRKSNLTKGIVDENNLNSQNNLQNLSNELENFKRQNEDLIQNFSEIKVNYKNTVDDFEYLKNQFCVDCVGENFVIDYKSIKNNEIPGITNNNNIIENNNGTNQNEHLNTSKIVESFMTDGNMRVDSQDNDMVKPNDESLNKKIIEMEKTIKEKQNLYEMKLFDYNNRMKYFEEKRKELLQIREQLFKKQFGSKNPFR